MDLQHDVIAGVRDENEPRPDSEAAGTVNKNSIDSMYTIGLERWNPNSWSKSDVSFGIRKAMEGTSSSITHIHM